MMMDAESLWRDIVDINTSKEVWDLTAKKDDRILEISDYTDT